MFEMDQTFLKMSTKLSKLSKISKCNYNSQKQINFAQNFMYISCNRNKWKLPNQINKKNINLIEKHF